MLGKDLCLTTDSSGRVMETIDTVTTLAPVVQMKATITSPVIVAATIPGTNLEVERQTTTKADISIHEPSPSLSRIKWNHGDYLSTIFVGDASKLAFSLDDAKLDYLTPFF